MIRFDQRNFDVHETERLFKKVIHPTHGHNAIRLVDKDGIPLRSPNSAALSRLQSSYVLTPRGVPARKSTHSYSGQITKDKMHNLVNTMDTNSHDIASFASSVHNYGLSSAGSSRHYIPVNFTSKKRTFGSGPPRSVKPMAKSASSERSRYLTMTPDENLILDEDSEKWNSSPQGKRLEKEWAALSQCRALKRSSEIMSHRVDRMYFMAGNKLKLQQKYHVEDDELQHLKELSQARASARPTRWSSRTKKGDIYRPERSNLSSKTTRTQGEGSEADSQVEQVNGVAHDASRKSSRASKEERVKENTDPASNIIVTQKPLTPKPLSKSPLQGWAEDSQGKRQPTDAELMSSQKDTTLYVEDQVDGLEVQSESGNTARENPEDSKDGLQNSEIVENTENYTKENGGVAKNTDIVENGKTEVNAENVNGVKEDMEERTGSPVFVTEGAGLGEQSVQEQENAGNVSSENKENEPVNGVVDKVDQNDRN